MSFRPTKIAELFGQDHLYDLLLTWFENKTTIPHSIIIQGPFGCGKTSIARMIAAKLTSCEEDILEENVGSSRSIDDVRSWEQAANFSPRGEARVFIFDEIQALTKEGQNALLKVLEEPPSFTYFIICTTDPGKILPALLSRCVKLEVKTLDKETMVSLVTYLTKKQLDPQTYDIMWSRSNGHPRIVIKDLETMYASGQLNPSVLTTSPTDNPQQFRELLEKLIIGTVSSQEMAFLLSYSNDQFLGKILDDTIDRKMFNNQKILSGYYQLLDVRSKRKQFLVSLNEQIRHLYSICRST